MYTGFLEYKTSDNFVRVRTVSYSEHDLAEFASTICEEKKKKKSNFWHSQHSRLKLFQLLPLQAPGEQLHSREEGN